MVHDCTEIGIFMFYYTYLNIIFGAIRSFVLAPVTGLHSGTRTKIAVWTGLRCSNYGVEMCLGGLAPDFLAGVSGPLT